ncbi:MAG: primosomal protein N' [Prevotellaceae bacterium]|nr:primosomal protein N' [Prevotellaceae bacterium]
MQSQYIDIILPLPLAGTFTYRIPEDGSIAVGMRVIVPFGHQNYTGIVYRLHNDKPDFEVKPVLEILDEQPILLPLQLTFWEWIAAYYQCTLGEVYNAALPARLKEAKKRKTRTARADLQTGRLQNGTDCKSAPATLNPFQSKAYEEIQKSFEKKNVTLLHGVTSSGKTEIYIHLIQKVLREGKQALYLVPEIALTAQLSTRLRKVFGEDLGIYHSKFSDGERVSVWNKLLNNEYRVILGVRSSIFLPFRDLGLIIIDEEHENTYKQFDPAPRYHARNAATVLASLHGAKTLLGTATPAIETYHNAVNGKYALVELMQRHEDIALPEIIVVDVKELRHKKIMKTPYSPVLLEKIKTALDCGEQVILFQNRRGFSPFLECPACAFVPKCSRCDVSLTYHKSTNRLACHYCGSVYSVPALCPKCKTAPLTMKGIGTERIEMDIEQLFPQARIARMDLDSTARKHSHEQIIRDFEEKKIDILIGTQMISKGLDFENVSVVGVLNADLLLNFPDFRAHERAFQLLTQVSGRAGRKNRRGLVVIQTTEPEHPVIQQVSGNDYRSLFEMQISERQLFGYPPFTRLINLTVKHRNEETLEKAVAALSAELQKALGNRVLGSQTPGISKIKHLHIRQFLIKLETAISAEKAKNIIRQIINNVQLEYRSLITAFDIDPM